MTIRGRIIVRTLALLMLGAIVNVAVAWACEYRDVESVRAEWARSKAVLKQRVNYGGLIETSNRGERQQKELLIAGWPTSSLYRVWSIEMPVIPRLSSIDQGITAPEPPEWLGVWGPARLPIRPLWPGFAINTVFYAAVLWLLFAAPFALRRRRRIKRGLCPKCAYPVGTNERCTECGVSVSRSGEVVAESTSR